ncbi:hypothetical protein N306_04762, partial [Opisthocomus hoazin]
PPPKPLLKLPPKPPPELLPKPPLKPEPEPSTEEAPKPPPDPPPNPSPLPPKPAPLPGADIRRDGPPSPLREENCRDPPLARTERAMVLQVPWSALLSTQGRARQVREQFNLYIGKAVGVS